MKVIERLFELQVLETGPEAASPEAQRAAETIRKEIPGPILVHYDRLRARGKKGVALVLHGVCTGCRMKLASGVYADLLRDEDVAMCDSCARYLLVAPDEASPPSSAPVETTSKAVRTKPTLPKRATKPRRRKPPAKGSA